MLDFWNITSDEIFNAWDRHRRTPFSEQPEPLPQM